MPQSIRLKQNSFFEGIDDQSIKELRRQILREHYEAVGKKGGSSTLQKHGREHFVNMAKAKKDKHASKENI